MSGNRQPRPFIFFYQNVGDSDVNSSDKDERDPDAMLCLFLGRPHGEPFGPGFGANIQTVQTDFLKLFMVAGHG
jgi:hypothetical protein